MVTDEDIEKQFDEQLTDKDLSQLDELQLLAIAEKMIEMPEAWHTDEIKHLRDEFTEHDNDTMVDALDKLAKQK